MNTSHYTIEPLEARIAPAVFTVTNLNDSGSGSLRAQLLLANAALTLHPGVINTIDFHLPAVTVPGASVIALGSELTSKGDVAIVGPGAGKLIIDAGGNGRAFDFESGDKTHDSPVSISGLSIIGGDATKNSGQGGAIYSLESLTLKNVVISGNRATNGGGVDVDGTGASTGIKATVTNCLIAHNFATNYAGGLFLTHLGSITISNTVIMGNGATNLSGGGIHADVTAAGAGIKIIGSEITGNTASFAGGALLADLAAKPSKITVSGSVVSGNTSTGTGAGGGGLYVSAGNTIISNTTVSNNRAVYVGAGIEAKGFGALSISASTISGNRTTTSNVGAIYTAAGVYIDGSSGATEQPVNITRSTIADNTCVNGTGGLIATGGVALTVSGSKFLGNSGGGAGGLETTGSGSTAEVNLTVMDSIFAGNLAESNGGGILTLSSGAVSITGSKITENQSQFGGGGAFFFDGNSTTVKDTIISANLAGDDGGGLDVVDTPFKITGGAVTNNAATQAGGGIYMLHAPGSIRGVTISGNTVRNEGGGVFNAGPSPDPVTLQVAKVTGNTAFIGPNVYGSSFTYV